MRRFLILLLLLIWLVAGCGPSRSPAPAPTDEQPATLAASPTPLATPSLTAPPPTPTAPPTATQTPDPYRVYTIDYLRGRSYGGGALELTEALGDNGRFLRYLVRYPSDALWIHGFMDVPKGDGPFPVVIALHGYIDPADYNTFDYTTRYADALANAGFLVIHPNLRGYSPSDDGDNLFRVGMAEDVLNLIALVKAQGGQPGPLEKADPGRIGLWGHSMGGGIATRVITVSPDVRAAVLYAPMSGDDRKNYEAISGWSGGTRGIQELSAPEAAFARISPEYYFDSITAAVSLNQGRSDTTVLTEWSEHTCALLTGLGKTVECNFYPGAGHIFSGQADEQFMYNMIHFLDHYLAPSGSSLSLSRRGCGWGSSYNPPVPITTLFVDLDDTLYPPSSGLWPVIRERIAGFMVERLGIPPAQADQLRRKYFEQYGTTLRGLEMNYQFERQDFLAYVHAVDLRAYIGPDPLLRAALGAIPCRKFILTNSDVHHVDRVTAILGVADCFDGIIDTNVLHPYCKPQREAFERALAASGESDPHRCGLIDDLPRTVRAAREFGMWGILYGTTTPSPDADAVFDDWSKLGEVVSLAH